MKKNRVAVAMSGGVDSSVAAFLLLKQGYDVTGYYMKILSDNYQEKEQEDHLKIIARELGIKIKIVDLTGEFENEVIQYFVDEYRNGFTPNPCIICNEKIKFGILRNIAFGDGCGLFATGHYARIDSETIPCRYLLKRGKDHSKDQAYFLFELGQEVLNSVVFPVGELSKKEVRQIAAKAGLSVDDRKESRDACFLAGNGYTGLLNRYGVGNVAGDIVLSDGTLLGEHKGCHNYTIGQRKGLRIAYHEPLYVLKIIPSENRIIVGTKKEVFGRYCRVKGLKMNCQPEKKEFECYVKIRYRHKESRACIRVEDDYHAAVNFSQPQPAITPGQAAVFYMDDIVLGGGWII